MQPDEILELQSSYRDEQCAGRAERLMEDVEDLLFDEPWLVITNCFPTKAYGGYDELMDKVRGYVVLKGQSCFTSS